MCPQAIWTMSVNVDEVCERIVQTGLHADMLANLGWDTLSAQTLNDPKSGTKRDFVEAHLATLHNVVRKTNTARGVLRQRKALDVLQKFRDCSEFPVIYTSCQCSNTAQSYSRRSRVLILLSRPNTRFIGRHFRKYKAILYRLHSLKSILRTVSARKL